MIPLADIDAAARRFYAAMLPTPQHAWPLLARRAGTKAAVIMSGGNVDRDVFARILSAGWT